MAAAYSNFFFHLTDYPPYGFQESIGLSLLKGDSVIFRAPTGAGKTWTTIAPFLFSLEPGRLRLADRLIYALPLRALATSLHGTVVKALEKRQKVYTQAKSREYPSDGIHCSLQMGGENNDPFFEGDIVFCTIDQVLSGYLMMPLSLPDQLGNIVAGALIGSLLVLDEAHLLDSGIALGTVIEMLDRLRGLVQFVFMTATMSDGSIRWLAEKLGAVVPDISVNEIRNLPVQRTKKRLWRWRAEGLTQQAVKDAHSGGRTLVVVNQVQRAQDLYLQLKSEYDGTNTQIACLHSRFFPQDRQTTENKLQPWFGRDATERDVILVTTQVVEAGIDISADYMLTELAPMNALIQRAGRTARYERRCEGIVSVFDVQRFLPYCDDKGEVARSRECLSGLAVEGELVDFQREQIWIEFVHGAVERVALASYNNLYGRRERVETALRTGERGYLRELVRDIDAVNLLLSNRPGDVVFSGAEWPALLSVPRSSIWVLKKLVKSGTDCIWKAKEVDAESGPLRFEWCPITSESELKGCWLIAVGSAAASYTTHVGLQLGIAGPEWPIRYTLRAPTPRYRYFYEPWVDHVLLVMGHAEQMNPANAIGAERLEMLCGLDVGAVVELVRLAAALHDVGKLSKGWQDAAWEWETRRTLRLRGEAIAHTTKGPEERGPKLPPHSVEGAYAVTPELTGRLPIGAWPVASAIARHHSSRAKESKPFELIGGASDLIRDLGVGVFALRDGTVGLDLIGFPLELEVDWAEDNRFLWPIYAYVARRLRLADQAGTASGANRGSDKS